MIAGLRGNRNRRLCLEITTYRVYLNKGLHYITLHGNRKVMLYSLTGAKPRIITENTPENTCSFHFISLRKDQFTKHRPQSELECLRVRLKTLFRSSVERCLSTWRTKTLQIIPHPLVNVLIWT